MDKSAEVLNICLIGPVPPPNGGMAMQTQQLYHLLVSRGHNVKLIAVNPPYFPGFIGSVPVVRSVFRLIPYFYRLFVGLKDMDVVHLMANSGWSFHLFVKPALWIAKLRQVPVVINYRGGKARQFFERSWKSLQSSFQASAAIAVPSNFLKEVFNDFGFNSIVVPNIINLSLFEFTQANIQAQNLHIVVTRNLEKIYDNETALKAFAIIHKRYPQARLTIAGSGPLREQLQDTADRLLISQQVNFVGRIDRQSMANLYADADIMLNPSTIDNMPNSVLEALASGVAVVSSNVGGIPYMVKDGEEALLVNPGDPEAMANAVFSLLESPTLANTLVNNGKNCVQKFTAEQVIPLLETTYLKAKL